MASSYLGHQEVVSRAVLLLFIPILALTTLLGEAGFRSLLARLERGRFSLERTLLAGSPAAVGAWVAEEGNPVESLVRQGVDIAGYVADPESAGAGLPPLDGGMIPWLGGRDEILEVVRRYRISQVVFWERPTDDDETWRRLAGLRRLRIRLRWNIPDVWLLAARTRTEMFGGRLSAVQETSSGTVLKGLARRAVALPTGLLRGLVGWLPWLVMKIFLVPGGRARVERVRLSDLWGHDPEVLLSLDGNGRPRSLVWQWHLAWPLLRGHLGLVGPRASLGEQKVFSREPDAVLAFWRSAPSVPGLTGSWAAAGSSGTGAFQAIIKQLWRDPGGFGTLVPAGDPVPEPEEYSRTDGEVS